MVTTMIGKTAQPSLRVKKTTFNGRNQQKHGGSGHGEIVLARSTSTCQSNLRSLRHDMDISSTHTANNLSREDRLSNGAREERHRDSTRQRSSEKGRERAFAEDDRQQSKVGKFKNKILSGGMRKERDHETMTDRDGPAFTSSGGRVGPILSQRTPPKRRGFKNGDFPGKTRHRSKSTPRQHPNPHIETALVADSKSQNESQRKAVDSASPTAHANFFSDTNSQPDGEESTSPESNVEIHNPNPHRRLGPRTTTASDILALISPKKKGNSFTTAHNSSPFNTTGPSVSGGIAQAIDLSDHALEHDLLEDDSTPSKRGGLKLQKKTLRRKHDKADKTVNSTSVGSNMSCICAHCAVDSPSTRSSDIDIDKAAIDVKIAEGLEVQELRKQLDQCELEVQAVMKAAARNEELFRSEIERFKRILGTVDQAQELRYQGLLEVFTDNFKTMGTVEARFEQMLGTRYGQMQMSGRGRLLQFLWVLIDFSVKALFQVAQTIYKSHKFIKGRGWGKAQIKG